MNYKIEEKFILQSFYIEFQCAVSAPRKKDLPTFAPH